MTRLLRRVRLPRWLLPAGWPRDGAEPRLADIRLAKGRIERVAPHDGQPAPEDAWDLSGAPVLPGLVDAHLHLDKTFTRARLGKGSAGLLGAIDAMMVDKAGWTPDDVHVRATRALCWAHEAGSVHLRTHCDWWDPARVPVAWPVLRELAEAWRGRLVLERVNLSPLTLYQDRAWAFATARAVAASGPGACLGGFVHATTWHPVALRHLFEAAQAHGLDVDLHCDEELNADAQGLAATAALLAELGFEGRVVCGHACALAAKPRDEALRILDAVARVPVTLIGLPVATCCCRTRSRAIRRASADGSAAEGARGSPVLLASDNVQDPVLPDGQLRPAGGVGAGRRRRPVGRRVRPLVRRHLPRRRAARRAGRPAPLRPGAPADLVVPRADAWGFPSRTQPRVVLRGGEPLAGPVPAAWTAGAVPMEIT